MTKNKSYWVRTTVRVLYYYGLGRRASWRSCWQWAIINGNDPSKPTTNQNSSLVQPVAPGSITQGPPHGSIGSSNAFPGGSSINNSGGTLPPPSTSSSITGAPTSSVGGAKRKEIYKYEAPWTVYSMNWSVRPDKRFRLALGSFVEEYNNKVSKLTRIEPFMVPIFRVGYQNICSRIFIVQILL